MALTRARKVLEYVVRDVFEHRIKEPPGTRPLENLLDRLVKERPFPCSAGCLRGQRAKTRATWARTISREVITAADVYQSLTQLMPILEWFFEEERPEAGMDLALPPKREEPSRTETVTAVPKSSRMADPVVPKGLRSFDAKDCPARFFELLPGLATSTACPKTSASGNTASRRPTNRPLRWA